jgi:hypothetical protein
MYTNPITLSMTHFDGLKTFKPCPIIIYNLKGVNIYSYSTHGALRANFNDCGDLNDGDERESMQCVF